VQAIGSHRHVYAGAVGPVTDATLEGVVEEALARLVPAFGLRGLASLDFIADHGHAWLLEINPRPSASMQLHADAWPGGLLRAHVDGVRGRLPQAQPVHRPGVRGHRVVFADNGADVDALWVERAAGSAHVHDRPAAGTRFARGEPVCSVSAEAGSCEAVLHELERLSASLQPRTMHGKTTPSAPCSAEHA
jgi:predicted ATP-grasp superfamily ATP-dependent carboligase